MRKLLSFLLVAMLVFTMLPIVHAEDAEEETTEVEAVEEAETEAVEEAVEDAEEAEEAEEEKLNPADFPKLNSSDFTVYLDGEEVNAKSYTLTRYYSEGDDEWTSEFFFIRLRDVAAMLNGTDGQFGIEFNKETKMVNLVPGEGYEPLPTDLTDREDVFQFVEKEAFFDINGIATEKGLDTIVVDNEHYMNLYYLTKALGGRFRAQVKYQDRKAYIYSTKSNVQTIDVESLKAKFNESDYTVLFVWAPW